MNDDPTVKSTLLDQLQSTKRAITYIEATSPSDIILAAFDEQCGPNSSGIIDVSVDMVDFIYLEDGSLTIQFDNVVTVSEDVGEEQLGRLYVNIKDEVVKGLW